MTTYLGIDTSTTATKAVLVGGDGAVLGVGKDEYGYDTPRSGWAEQDPVLWWNGTIAAFKAIPPSMQAAASITAGAVRPTAGSNAATAAMFSCPVSE